MVRLLCLCTALLLVAGCVEKQPLADRETIAAVSYRNPGPSTLALYTMVNNRTGKGGHTSLMINASERVIFDPAGSFRSPVVPERNDVLFGITPGVELAYRGSHARSTFHVVVQTVEVTPEQAEIAYQLALNNGAVPGIYCANATSTLLKKVPGFESVDVTFYPTRLEQQFGSLPGVRTERYFENDSADLDQGIAQNNARLVAQQQLSE
ncbi:hypothetical protein [Antarcticimicrobium sediminis]|uniref:Lipoprotein n=1 Tax=Antarcticimicrobium sediminis TaxID=2546227 RepID=A0A4R5EXI1_9RHOB|nr:hypothetical protein [Antarcticimicrobium sediminis]TDE39769.1 hypothetical protein E1B25_06890 [Antarcticimicrobium sediminis]